MSVKKADFSEILREDWHLPPELQKPASVNLPPSPTDNLDISLQAAKRLPDSRTPKPHPTVEIQISSLDCQGNRTRVSATAKALAENIDPAWETKL